MATYTPPPWAAAPKHDFWLEVIKDGVVVDTVSLSAPGKDHLLAGRQADAVDVVAAHDSVSRRHAVFQFGEAGELYLVDLGSTHGTRVNKQRVKPHAYTYLPVGSVVQFGESSRLYVVQGPSDMQDEEVISERRAALRQAAEARAARKEGTAGGGDASSAPATADGKLLAAVLEGSAEWDMHGGGGGAVEEEGEGDDVPAFAAARRQLRRLAWLGGLDVSPLSEKDRVAYDRLWSRYLKLKNVLSEADKVKHGGVNVLGRKPGRRGDAFDDGDSAGLSAAQVQRLSNAESSAEKLVAALEEDESSMRERLSAKGLWRGPPPAAGVSEGDGEERTRREKAALNAWVRGDRDEVEGDVVDVSGRGGGRDGGSARSRAKIVLTVAGRSVAVATTTAAVPPSSAPTAQPPHTTSATPSSARPPDTAAGGGGKLLTHETLVRDLRDVNARLMQAKEELARWCDAGTSGGDDAAADGSEAGGGDDDLDAFMRQHDATWAAAQKQEAEARVRSMQAEQQRLQALVAFTATESAILAPPAAAPAGDSHVDATDGAIGAKRPRAVDGGEVGMVEAGGSKRPRVGTAKDGDGTARQASVDDGSGGGGVKMGRPDSTSGGLAAVWAKAQGGLEHVTMASRHRGDRVGNHANRPGRGGDRHHGAGATAYDEVEGEEAVPWMPPAGQTGDGRTALNAKLGY